MIIAVDFDSCLSEANMQSFIRKARKSGNEIWVITKRREGEHNVDLFKVLDKVGLSIGQVVFTNNKAKFDFVKALNADIFIDNESGEFEVINDYTNTIPLKYGNSNSREQSNY